MMAFLQRGHYLPYYFLRVCPLNSLGLPRQERSDAIPDCFGELGTGVDQLLDVLCRGDIVLLIQLLGRRRTDTGDFQQAE